MAIQINGVTVIDTSGFFNGLVLEEHSGVPSGSAEPGTLRYHSKQLYLYNGNNWINVMSAEAATGGNLISDGVTRIHEFLSSGQLIVNYPYSFNYEILAGGGGGGGAGEGGGGGAGGYRTGTMTVPAGNYSVTVGSGGAVNAKGGDSTFSSITSTGGGQGQSGRTNSSTAPSGGCGGGGAGTNGPTNPGGSGNSPSVSPSQGNPGGAGNGSVNVYPGGGGGGGIGSPGQNKTSDFAPAGNGGNGSLVYGIVRGGGGGGGQYYDSGQPSISSGNGGTGGGGTGGGGSNLRPATAGLANHGAGGGGIGWRRVPGIYFPGQPGGSGIVIVSYSYGN